MPWAIACRRSLRPFRPWLSKLHLIALRVRFFICLILASAVVLFCGYSVSGRSRRFLARKLALLRNLPAAAVQALVIEAPLDCVACAILHLASSLHLLSFSSVATVSQDALAGFSPESIRI